MLITILTTGSRGDTQPYVALGLELKKAGHAVRIVAFENFESFVKSYGLDFYPIKGDVVRVASSINAQEGMKADNPLKFLLSFQKLQLLVFDVQKDFFNACEGSDVIIYHPGAAIGYFIAQYLKIPSILATPFPMTATGDFPALIFYDTVRLGRSFNLITHKIFENIMWFASSSPIKQFWKQKFGKIPENFSSPFRKQNSRNLPTVISCSKYVFPRPADWPENVYYYGYWFLDEENGWEPPADLVVFLQKGTPPVYIGFGSVGDPKLAVQTTQLAIEALTRCGQRGVLATGWSGMAHIDNLPNDIFILENAPHAWLFPRMAAVVHHGGAGTTAAGLRAGVPGIIIPSGNDQFAWGRRIYELGVGAKPIPRKQLSAEKLSEAIKFALTEEIKNAAKNLGAKIQAENGAEATAKMIDQYLESTASHL